MPARALRLPSTRGGAFTRWQEESLRHVIEDSAFAQTFVIPELVADGISDDGPRIQAAIDALVRGGTVLIPPGTYLISGFNIRRYDVTVQFMPGTTVRLTQTIEITKSKARLLGPALYSRTSDAVVPSPLFTWAGAINSPMIYAHQDPVGQELNGVHIGGLEMYGGGVAGVTGVQLSTEDGGPGGFSFGLLEDLVIREVFRGILVGFGTGQTYIVRPRLHCTDTPNIVAGSIGLAIGTANTLNAISIYVSGGTIENFDTLIEIGADDTSPDTVQINDMAGLDGWITAALHIKRGSRIFFERNHCEAGSQSPNKTAVILGSVNGIAKDVSLVANDMLDALNGGWLIEGINWENVAVVRNSFTALTGWKIWKYVGGGTQARATRYYGNFLNLSSAMADEIDNLLGFDYIQRSQPSGGAYFEQHPLVETARYSGRIGRDLVAGDFALDATWGSTASVGTISGSDIRATFTVTSAGVGQAANPTLTLTFKDLDWPAAPFAIVSRNGGNQPAVLPTWTTTATTLVITFPGTPVAGETYTFSILVMG